MGSSRNILTHVSRSNSSLQDVRVRSHRFKLCAPQAQGVHHDATVTFDTLPRIIIQRTSMARTFSATFNGQSVTSPVGNHTAPALQLTYSAAYSGLEVYNYNISSLKSVASVAWDVGSIAAQQNAHAKQLCRQLLMENPGKSYPRMDSRTSFY